MVFAFHDYLTFLNFSSLKLLMSLISLTYFILILTSSTYYLVSNFILTNHGLSKRIKKAFCLRDENSTHEKNNQPERKPSEPRKKIFAKQGKNFQKNLRFGDKSLDPREKMIDPRGHEIHDI